MTGIGHFNIHIPGDIDVTDAIGIAEYGYFDGLDATGIDDDCDGYVDSDDSDCSSDYLSGYAGVANAEAASYGSISLTGSGSFNALTLLLVPIGTVIFLRVLRWRNRMFRATHKF